MPKLSRALPAYRKHRASGQALVTLNGRDHYLGPHGTKASKLEYDRLISEWLANGRSAPAGHSDKSITVVELTAEYVRYLKAEYANFAEPGSEPNRILAVLRVVKKHYSRTQVAEFGPLSLKAVRQRFIDSGQCRSFVNDNTRRVVRMFKWGVANELVSPEILRGLQAVEGLRRDRSNVREGRTVHPVSLNDVEKTLPHLPPILADVVRLQLLLGCRPTELLTLRPDDVERLEPNCWAYRPSRHKNSHRGQVRTIYLGPKAIEILTPYLLRPASSFCFDPRESERHRRDTLHDQRKTPLSCGNRPGTNRKDKPARSPGPRYTRDSYRRAVERAAKNAGVPSWTPYQLRHARATQVRELFGVEAVQSVLGHSKVETSQIYASKTDSLARDVVKQIG